MTKGELLQLAPGDVLTPKTGPVRGLYIVLDGLLSIYVDRGKGPQKVMEWHGGDVTGVLPYSRIVGPPGDVTAEEPTEILKVDRELLPNLIHDCPVLTGNFVHAMVDRARQFTSANLQSEKLASLGKLAAGLAHELNNPSSAVARSAESLEDRLLEVEIAARAFGAAALSPEQHAVVNEARALVLDCGSTTIARSALARADREDAIAAWLERHGGDSSAASALADSAITEEALDRLAGALSGEPLRLALAWLVAECAAHQLVTEVKTAASRIHTLVAAVKGFTYMDQAMAEKPVDIGQGLSDTIVVLGAKAREKVVKVTLDVEPDLPRVMGLGGWLNQVWANLLDNALDVAKREIVVSAARGENVVVVRVRDDGPGVPEEVQKRVFDPFFTTKPPGEGTGLGLDTVRRLVLQHHGTVDLHSQPGRTEFVVTLPVGSDLAAIPPVRATGPT